MDKTECQIIEDCPHFMYGCCQKYLDGDCSTHKYDLKIIRELQQKLLEGLDYYVKPDLSRVEEYNELVDKYKAKEQECDKLKFNLKGTGILGLMKRNVQLKKALDEIEKICQIKEENSQFVLPSVWQQILEIINKVKESE